MAGGGSWLARPEPVERSIGSRLDPDALAARLHDAATHGRRSARVDGSPYVVQLGWHGRARRLAPDPPHVPVVPLADQPANEGPPTGTPPPSGPAGGPSDAGAASTGASAVPWSGWRTSGRTPSLSRTVELEARLLRADGTAGRPKRPLLVTGAVDDRLGGGSTLRVRIEPDDRRTLAWVIAIPAIAVALMAAAGLPPLAIVAVGGLAVPNVLGAIRAGQRFPFRSLSLVEALLEEIAGGI